LKGRKEEMEGRERREGKEGRKGGGGVATEALRAALLGTRSKLASVRS
jgi:hypothetical protein